MFSKLTCTDYGSLFPSRSVFARLIENSPRSLVTRVPSCYRPYFTVSLLLFVFVWLLRGEPMPFPVALSDLFGLCPYSKPNLRLVSGFNYRHLPTAPSGSRCPLCVLCCTRFSSALFLWTHPLPQWATERPPGNPGRSELELRAAQPLGQTLLSAPQKLCLSPQVPLFLTLALQLGAEHVLFEFGLLISADLKCLPSC